MGIKEVMGTLSPAYGMTTGKGLFGSAVGVLPAIAKDIRDEKEKEKEEKAALAASAPTRRGMKKGGADSSASKRADGCAIKGKTRGRMV